MILLLIAIGGATGSVARYLFGGAIQKALHPDFPIGTLVVNVVGCIAIGLFWRAFMGDPRENQMKALLVTGFCGGFTTFSAFSMETVGLIQGGAYGRAALYVFASVGAGLAGTVIALRR